MLVRPGVANPLEPGRGSTPETQDDLPVVGEPDLFRVVRAGTQRRIGNRVEIGEGAEIEARGYRLLADRIEGDLQTRVFSAIGNAQLFGKDVDVVGERIEVDFRNRTFRAQEARSLLRPGFTKGQVQGDLVVQGGEAEGDEGEIRAAAARLSTCTLEEPHYHVDSRTMRVLPGRRAILRDVRIDVLDRTILRLPYLVVPLDETFYRYLPEIGNNSEEGWFIKTRWGVPLPGENNLTVRADAFSKIGGALGGDLDYKNARMSGRLSGYTVFGNRQSVQFSGFHQMNVGKNSLSLDGSFQEDNYLSAPGSTVYSLRSGLEIPQGLNRTRLTYVRSGSRSSGFETLSQNWGIADSRSWNSKLRTDLDFALARDESLSAFAPSIRQEANLQFSADQDLDRARALLEYQRTIPVGESGGFAGGIDRTPVLTLSTDERRLFGPSAKLQPFRGSMSWGQFVDRFQDRKTERLFFDFETQRTDGGQGRTSLDWSTRFRQGLYSDDTAQYTLDLNGRLSYRLGKDTSANVRYGTLRFNGYSPLSQDQASDYDQLSFDLSVRPRKDLLVGAETAYDFLQMNRSSTPWQSLGVRTEYEPTDWFRFRATSLYDTFSQAWSNVRIDLGWKPGATYVGVGARYDGLRHTWASANVFVDGLKAGRLKTSALLQYNGYLKKFEARHFSFTYDLHCSELIFQIIDNPLGFRSGTQYGLYLRLKAFPFATPFGIGQQGQPIGIGTGRDF